MTESALELSEPAPASLLGPLGTMSDTVFDAHVAQARLGFERVAKLVANVLELGTDYGVIPGTKKPTLLKPGAEKLCNIAGLTAQYKVERIVGMGPNEPPLVYTVRCDLVDAHSILRGSGVGTTSAWEKRYRYRHSERVCPSCGEPTIKEDRKADSQQAFYCWRKLGGCGQTWNRGTQAAAEIDAQQAGVTENEDPHDLDNTLCKMACKRSKVAAVLDALCLSGFFTQDLEDGAGAAGDDRGFGQYAESESDAGTRPSDGDSSSAPRQRKASSRKAPARKTSARKAAAQKGSGRTSGAADARGGQAFDAPPDSSSQRTQPADAPTVSERTITEGQRNYVWLTLRKRCGALVDDGVLSENLDEPAMSLLLHALLATEFAGLESLNDFPGDGTNLNKLLDLIGTIDGERIDVLFSEAREIEDDQSREGTADGADPEPGTDG